MYSDSKGRRQERSSAHKKWKTVETHAFEKHLCGPTSSLAQIRNGSFPKYMEKKVIQRAAFYDIPKWASTLYAAEMLNGLSWNSLPHELLFTFCTAFHNCPLWLNIRKLLENVRFPAEENSFQWSTALLFWGYLYMKNSWLLSHVVGIRRLIC